MFYGNADCTSVNPIDQLARFLVSTPDLFQLLSNDEKVKTMGRLVAKWTMLMERADKGDANDRMEYEYICMLYMNRIHVCSHENDNNFDTRMKQSQGTRRVVNILLQATPSSILGHCDSMAIEEISFSTPR